MKLIEIDKRLYAIGMSWRLTESSKKKPLFDDGRQGGFDVYTTRQSHVGKQGNRQVGYLDSQKESQALQAFSLAASLASSPTLAKAFIGIFCLRDIDDNTSYNLITINNGIIYDDLILFSLEEAQTKIISIEDLFEKDIFDENKVICETHEASCDFIVQHLPLQKTIMGKIFPKFKLYPLYKTRSQNTKMLFVLLAIVSIPIFYVTTKTYVEKQEKNALLKAHQEHLQRKEDRKNSLQANAYKEFKQAWKGKALPSSVFPVWQEALFRLPLVTNGWVLAVATCSETELTSQWRHETQASYVNLPFNGVLQDNKSVFAHHTLPSFEFVTNEVDYTNLLLKNEVSKQLYQLTQDMGAKVKLKFYDIEVKEFADMKITISAPWQRVNFSLEAVPSLLLLDNSLFQKLDAIPSLFLTKIQYKHGNTGLWIIVGEFYVGV